MTEHERQQLELYMDLFTTAGWKLFMQDLTEAAEGLANIEGIKDAKELHTRQGEVMAMARIINMEATFEAALEAEDA